MASVKNVLRARAQARKEKAERGLVRLEDRSLDREQLLAAMAAERRKEIDLDATAMREARADLELLERPVAQDDDDEEPGPQLELFGQCYPFGADRMIVGPDGKTVIENKQATLRFKAAERDRAMENVRRARVHELRKIREVEHFAAWVQEQAEAGRPALDLTWGACARETGILRQA